MFSVSSSDPAETPALLRFRIPAGVDPNLLAVATQEEPSDAWALLRGQVIGDSYMVQTDHLSPKQLRELDCPSQLQDPIDFKVSAQTMDPSEPILIACAATVDGKPAFRVYNTLSNALEFVPPPGTAIAEVKGHTLGGRVAELAAQLQTQDKLLPGGGVVTVSFDQPPGSIDFTVEGSAATFEAALTVLGTDAPVEAIQCLYDASQSVKDADLTNPGELAGVTIGVLNSCKGLLPAAAKSSLGAGAQLPSLLGKSRDLIAHFREAATVSITGLPAASLPDVQPAPEGQTARPDTGTATVGEQVGDLNLDAYCLSHGYYDGVVLIADRYSANSVNAWRCQSAGQVDSIDIQAACRWQYSDPSLVAQPLDVNDAFTWRCYMPPGTP
jgi:hypothetical protein